MENHSMEKEKGNNRDLKSYFFWKTGAIVAKMRFGSDHWCWMKGAPMFDKRINIPTYCV